MAEKRGETSDKLALKQALRKKVNFLLKKPRLEAREAYGLIKSFFKAYTENNYEYTREELLKELDKVYVDEETKAKLSRIIMNLGIVEFAPVEYDPEIIKQMLNEFVDSVDTMVHPDKSTIGFWDRLTKRMRSKANKKEKKKEPEEPSLIDTFIDEVGDIPAEETVEVKEIQPEIPEEEFQPKKDITNSLGDLQDIFDENDAQEVVPPEIIKQDDSKLTKEELDWTESPIVTEEVPVEQEAEPEPEVTEPLPDVELVPEQTSDSSPQPVEEPGSPGIEPGQPSPIGEGDFDKRIEEFYLNLEEGNMDLARLDYEEMKQEYELLDVESKKLFYDKLLFAHKAISGYLGLDET